MTTINHNDDLKALITIGSLPAIDNLKNLFNQGIKDMINVSGIDLIELYPEKNLSCFNQYTYLFSDLFSKHDIVESLSELNGIDSQLFLREFNSAQQAEFKSAVIKTIQLLHRNKSIFIFCHHGVGRSPAVSFAALNIYFKQSIYESLKMVESVRPQAKITKMTISATYWLKEMLSNE